MSNITLLSSLRVSLREAAGNDARPFTLYDVQVIGSAGEISDSWTIQRRYRQFHSLHKELGDLVAQYDSIFPPKRLLKNRSPENIAFRIEAIPVYVNTIARLDTVRNHPIFRDFFGVPAVLRGATVTPEPVGAFEGLTAANDSTTVRTPAAESATPDQAKQQLTDPRRRSEEDQRNESDELCDRMAKETHEDAKEAHEDALAIDQTPSPSVTVEADDGQELAQLDDEQQQQHQQQQRQQQERSGSAADTGVVEEEMVLQPTTEEVLPSESEESSAVPTLPVSQASDSTDIQATAGPSETEGACITEVVDADTAVDEADTAEPGAAVTDAPVIDASDKAAEVEQSGTVMTEASPAVEETKAVDAEASSHVDGAKVSEAGHTDNTDAVEAETTGAVTSEGTKSTTLDTETTDDATVPHNAQTGTTSTEEDSGEATGTNHAENDNIGDGADVEVEAEEHTTAGAVTASAGGAAATATAASSKDGGDTNNADANDDDDGVADDDEDDNGDKHQQEQQQRGTGSKKKQRRKRKKRRNSGK